MTIRKSSKINNNIEQMKNGEFLTKMLRNRLMSELENKKDTRKYG